MPGKKDFDFVRIAQNAIYQNYIADMAKYSTPADAIKTIAVYDSIPVQLAKENKKFPYRLIKSGVRASAYEFSMDWLKKAGVIISCNKITEGQVSLDYYKDQSSYKIYLSDVGLLTGKSNLPASLILADSSIGSGVKGALTENYVAQELVAGGHIPFYWESGGKAELDFVIQRKEEILAIECKSAESVKAKSLNLFLKKYNLPWGIRISAKNFGLANQIKSVPLYAVFCI